MHVMETRARGLPNDISALKALVHAERERVAERDLQIAHHDSEIATHKQSIAALEHNLHLYAKWLWGPRSEKRPVVLEQHAAMPSLPCASLLEDVQRLADRTGVEGRLEVEAPKEARAKTATKRRSSFPEHLPRVRTTIELPKPSACAAARPWRRWAWNFTKNSSASSSRSCTKSSARSTAAASAKSCPDRTRSSTPDPQGDSWHRLAHEALGRALWQPHALPPARAEV